MNSLDSLITELKNLENKEKAKVLQGFFKTGKGQYGEGDIFLGITVPQQRIIAKKYNNLDLDDIQRLLDSKIHEHRLVSLLILVRKYEETKDKSIADFYLKNARKINNWDLVDSSADRILGDYLTDKDRSILLKLAKSENLWERRIAIISTFNFIKKGETQWTFRIAEILMDDKHYLIHKAVGWMLREAGKKVSLELEEEFLKKHYKTMPRTMLRYAIERFDADKRKFYLD